MRVRALSLGVISLDNDENVFASATNKKKNKTKAEQSKAFENIHILSFQRGPIRDCGQSNETPIRIAPDADVVDTSERKQSGRINSPAFQRATISFQTDSKEVTHRFIEKRNSVGIQNTLRTSNNKRNINFFFKYSYI